MIRSLLPVFLVCLLTSAAPAQGIKAVMQSLAGPEKAATPELTPAEQMAWAQTQLKGLPSEDAIVETMRPRVEKAGLPASVLEDFRAATREARRNYQNAIDALTSLSAAGQEPPLPALAPPRNEKEADGMREALRKEDLAARASENGVDLLERQIAQQQALSEKTAVQIRQLNEEASLAKSPEAAARAQIQAELAALQKQSLDAAIFGEKWKVAGQTAAAKLARAAADSLRSALRESGYAHQIDSRRAQKQLDEVSAQTAEAEKALASAVREQDRAQQALAEIKADPASAGSARLSAAQDLLAASQGLVAVLRGTVRILDIERSHWLAVKDLTQNPSSATVREAIGDARENLQLIEEWRPTMNEMLIESRENLEAAQRALKAASQASARTTLEKAVASLQKRDAALGALLTRTQAMAVMQQEFLAEVETTLSREGAARRLARAWDAFWASLGLVWRHELFSMGGNSITVGKVALSVLGFILSLALAGMLSRFAGRAASKNFRIAPTQRTLLEKSVFVPAAALFVLIVLYWLNIPLTVFAFFGGALAIGVGFGVQNLMNNFISGIILLLEHQIKVGDIIEVAGSTGKVTHLGSRCSRIRKFDGVELLVPNSAFLEREVTNWTLADPHHRYDFPVGVAYGSPVEKVMDLLASSLERQQEILHDPAPGVFFEDFGESSLVFRVFYWLEVGGTTDPRLVGSQLRVRIERDFRAAGIEMPFPQRDLHLRSAEAVRVRLEDPNAS